MPVIFTHLIAKIAGIYHFLINPYGVMFDEVTASSLVKVNLQGEKVMASDYDIIPAGFLIHSTVHAARPDAHYVMHIHSVNGIAVSAQAGGLLALSQQSLFVLSVQAGGGGLITIPDEVLAKAPEQIVAGRRGRGPEVVWRGCRQGLMSDEERRCGKLSNQADCTSRCTMRSSTCAIEARASAMS